MESRTEQDIIMIAADVIFDYYAYWTNINITENETLMGGEGRTALAEYATDLVMMKAGFINEASLKNIQRVVHPSNSVMIETELEKNISK